MKSLRLHGLRNLQLHNEPTPVPSPIQQLLKISSVGICGSDLHWFSDQGIGDARLEAPLVLGHEFSASTVTGERVAVDPALACGCCEYCLRGHPNLCPDVVFAGHGRQDGALREFMAWPTKCLFPIPDALSDDDGAMLEPLGVAIHAVDLAHFRTGMSAAVLGSGPIGLLIIQLLKLSGASNIIATDLLPHRVEAARALGAQHSMLAEDRRETDKFILAASAGRGVDLVFDAAGSQDAVDTALEAVIPGGKLILVGIPSDDITCFPASVARRKGLTIKLVRRMKHTYPRAIDLVARHQVDVHSLVTHRFRLEQAAEAFDTAERREGLKIMIQI